MAYKSKFLRERNTQEENTSPASENTGKTNYKSKFMQSGQQYSAIGKSGLIPGSTQEPAGTVTDRWEYMTVQPSDAQDAIVSTPYDYTQDNWYRLPEQNSSYQYQARYDELKARETQAMADLDTDAVSRIRDELNTLNRENGTTRFDRVKNMIIGGAKSAASSFSAGTGSLYGITQGARSSVNENLLQEYQSTLDRAQRDLEIMLNDPDTDQRDIQSQQYIIEDAQRKYDAMAKVVGEKVQERAATGALDIAEQAKQSSAVDVAKAGEGLAPFEQGAIRLGSGLVTMGMENAVGGPIGRALGQYGSSVLTAREAGLDENKQALAGAISAGGVLAGSAASNLVDITGLKLLRKVGMQNDILPNILLGGFAASGYSIGNTGMNELAKAITQEDYKPDWSQIGSDALTAFAFGAIRQTVRVARTTSQNKAYIESLNEEVQRRYEIVKGVMVHGSPEQQAQGAQSVMDGIDQLRNALNNLRVVGASAEMKEINDFLDSISVEMYHYLTAMTPTGDVPPAGSASAPTSTQPAPSAAPQAGLTKTAPSPAGQTTARPVEAVIGGPAPSIATAPQAPITQEVQPVQETAPAPAAAPFQTAPAQAVPQEAQTESIPDSIETAVQIISDTGSISNTMAEQILNDPAAVSVLEDKAGLILSDDMKQSARRNAVKSALKRLASQSAGQDAAEMDSNATAQEIAAQAPQNTATEEPAQIVQQGPSATASVQEFAGTLGKAGKSVLESMQIQDDQAGTLVPVLSAYYESGKESGGKPFSAASVVAPATPQLAEAMYIAGQADAGIDETTAAGYNSDNDGGVLNGTEEVYLRRGGERTDGENTGGTVRVVESGAGQNQGGQIAAQPADRGASGLSYGEAVSTASLGIAGGSTENTIRVVTGGDTAATKAAKAYAKDRGLRLVLFSGDNLTITQNDGTKVSARGMIAGDRVFVRVDHPLFTADQIVRHEIGHDKIAKGEIDPDTVRDRIADELGADRVQEVAGMYEEAYRGSGLTKDEVWKEIICDSEGDMNIFAGLKNEQAAGELLESAKNAVKSTEQDTQNSRGPPAQEKTSRELNNNGGAYQDGEERKAQNQHEFLAEQSGREYKTGRIGEIAYAYREVSHFGTSLHAEEAAKELKRLGIRSFFHDGLKWNENGYTYTDHGMCSAIADSIVGIRKDAFGDPKEMAGHEAFHIWGNSENRKVFKNTIRGLIDQNSFASIQIAQDVATQYFGDGPIDKALFGEEYFAKLAGMLNSGEQADTMRQIFTDYDAAQRAWNALVDNHTPTKINNKSDGNVKQKFSMETPVEATDRLIAIHNMSEDALRGALELGGLAMPSIVVTRADLGHSAYGDISLVFGRDTISPTDRRNSIYSGDAYTPTFPEVGYKISEKAARNLRARVNALFNGESWAEDLHIALDDDNLRDRIERRNGDFEAAYGKEDGLRLAFLKDTGRSIDIPKKEKSYTVHTDIDGLRSLIRLFGEDEPMNTGYKEEMEREPEIRASMHNWAVRKYGEDIANKMYPSDKALDFSKVDNLLRAASDYRRTGRTEQTDTSELYNKLGKLFSSKKISAEYSAWLSELSDGIVEKKGVRNNRDFFSPSGNRRSFEQLYYDYTLSNIVRVMQGEEKQGKAGLFTGSGNIRGASAMTYPSIEDARSDIGRIQSMTDEAKDSAYKAFDDKCLDLCSRMIEGKGMNAFAVFDAAEVLTEAIAKYKTEDGIYRYLVREYGGYYNVDRSIAHEAYALIQEARKLPTSYLEAKAYRAVGFDEVLAVVAPRNMDKNLRQQLSEAGVTVKSYKTGDEADRLAKINSVHGARFSRELDSIDELRTENRRLRDLAKRKSKQAEYWRGQTKQTTPENRTLRQSDVNKLARRLLSDFDSKANFADLTSSLKDLGEYLLRGEAQGVDSNVLMGKAVDIGYELVTNAVRDDEYADLRKYLRDTKITIAPEDSHDIADYGDFRKRNFGRLRLGGGHTNVDQVYQELSDRWPEFFKEDQETAPSDQLVRIAEVLDTLDKIDQSFDFDVEAAAQYAAEAVLDGIMSEDVRQTPPTFADRQARKLDEAKAHGKDAVAAQRLADDMYYGRKLYSVAEKGRQAVERERAKRKEQIQRLKDHYADTRRAQADRKADSRARSRLLQIAKRLQNRKLPAVTRSLLEQYIGELDTVAKSMTGETLEKLTALREWYEDKTTEGSPIYDPDFIPDDSTKRKLERLSKKQIGSLSSEEVAALTEVLLNIENEIQTSKKLIDSEDRRDVYFMGEDVIRDVNGAVGSKKGLKDTVTTALLSPERQMRRITGYVDSDPLAAAAKGLSAGQRTMYAYQMLAEKPFEKFAKDRAFSQMFSGKKARGIQITGQIKDGLTTVTISPAMRTALYLHSLNDQNLRHIRDGGVTVPDWKFYQKGDLAEAYARGTTIKLTPTQVRNITAGMTEQEKAFARASSHYFNEVSQPAINAVSEKLKGYSIAQVENYFPINTDKKYNRAQMETVLQDISIEGMGFLKERVEASNPILLRDADAVLNQSIQQHSKYVGLAIPIRNFNKLWDVTATGHTENGSKSRFDDSVKSAVARRWGDAGVSYVEKMVADLQGKVKRTDAFGDWLGAMRSNYAGAVLTLNAGVAAKQAASYPTAAAVIGWKPLIRAIPNLAKSVVAVPKMDTAAKYTPLFWYRAQGYSTQELGDMTSRQKHMPKALNWIQHIDLATTAALWKASEYYVRQSNKALQIGSDAYYKAVAEVYNRVIEETQPNYNTMQRPQLLRSENELVKTLNMFKTQPFQNFNILYDAWGELAAKMRQKRSGAATSADVKRAKAGFALALSSQAVSAFIFALMQYGWDLFRDKDDKYKDQSGENSLSDWLRGMGVNMATNGFGMIPFGTELFEWASSSTDKILAAMDKDQIFDTKFYGFEISILESLTDAGNSSISALVSSIVAVINATDKDDTTGTDWEALARGIYKAAEDISELGGLPTGNVKNLLTAAAAKVLAVNSGEYVGGYYALRITTDPNKYPKDYYDLLYRAKRNDEAEYQKLYDIMLENGFDAQKIKSNMENRMKDEQGVTEVKELEERFYTPDQQEVYDMAIDRLTGSQAWRAATDEQQAKAKARLHDYVTGTGNKDALKKVEEAQKVGIDAGRYALYKLALEVVDKPNDSGNLGTYTNDEVEEAIRMLAGLSDTQRSWLWTAQGKSENSNPWG